MPTPSPTTLRVPRAFALRAWMGALLVSVASIARAQVARDAAPVSPSAEIAVVPSGFPTLQAPSIAIAPVLSPTLSLAPLPAIPPAAPLPAVGPVASVLAGQEASLRSVPGLPALAVPRIGAAGPVAGIAEQPPSFPGPVPASDAPSVRIPKPSALRDALWYYRGALETAAWYTGPRLFERWEEINRMVGENGGETPSVPRLRGFFVEQRLLGTGGGIQPSGFKVAPSETSLEDARAIYARYFPKDPAARSAFDAFLDRTQDHRATQRMTHFRKTIMYAMRDAAVLPVRKLEGFFGGLLRLEENEVLERFQREQMDQVMAAFGRHAEETIVEMNRELPPGKRVVAVALYGSYATGTPGPESDLDTQVIIEDNSRATKDEFMSRFTRRWKAAGWPMPINGFSFAVPPSRGVLERVHPEPYRIYSPYPEATAALSREQDVDLPPPPRPGWNARVFNFLYGRLIYAITWGYDLYHKFRR